MLWNMDKDHITYMGTRQSWGDDESLFGVGRDDRRQHAFVIGKTGTGKTTLLRNLVLQDILAGRGVGVIDPHGDLALDLLDFIPPQRTDDVVYFDPADHDYPIGLNLLQHTAPHGRHLVASGLVSIFKSIWHDSWGPRLEYILYAAVAALLECQNTSLLGVPRMLTDSRYRDWVLRQVHDPIVRSFWIDEFGNYDQRFLREAIAPIQNKVGQLLMTPLVRNILGQVGSKVDPRFMMDNRRIFIANLSKGRLGADKANLLGAMLVTQFQLAAMQRANIPEHEREDFYLYIDEVHNFTTDSFASILSEMRKFRLSLLLLGQYLGQLRADIRDAVFGNVGSLIAFRVGEQDAQVLSREFGEEYSARYLAEMGNHRIVAKLLVNGETAQPFAGRTLPPDAFRFGRRANLIRRSREKYARPRALVEDRIRRWMRPR